MHTHSKEAYRSIMASGAKASRTRAILEIFKRNSRPLSDYQILQKFKSGSDNLNLVRPRITELHQMGVLVEDIPIKSHDGNRNVRTCKINPTLTLIDNQVGMFD